MTSTMQERTGLYSRLAPVRPAGLPTIHIPANAVNTCVFKRDDVPKTKSQTDRMPPVPGVRQGKEMAKRRATIPYSHKPRFQESGESSDIRKSHPLSLCLSATRAAQEAKAKQLQLRKQWNITDGIDLTISPHDKEKEKKDQVTIAQNEDPPLRKTQPIFHKKSNFLKLNSQSQRSSETKTISKSKSQISGSICSDSKSAMIAGSKAMKTLMMRRVPNSEFPFSIVSKSSSDLTPQQEASGKLLARRSSISANRTKSGPACKSAQSNSTQYPVFRFTKASFKSFDEFPSGIPVDKNYSASTQRTHAGAADGTGESKNGSQSKVCHIENTDRSGYALDIKTRRSCLQESRKTRDDAKSNSIVGLRNPRHDNLYMYKTQFSNVLRKRNKVTTTKVDNKKSPIFVQKLGRKFSGQPQVTFEGVNDARCQSQSDVQIENLLSRIETLGGKELKCYPSTAAEVKSKEKTSGTSDDHDGPESRSSVHDVKRPQVHSAPNDNPGPNCKDTEEYYESSHPSDSSYLNPNSFRHDDIDKTKSDSPAPEDSYNYENVIEIHGEISPENDAEIDLSKLVSSILDHEPSQSVASSEKASLDSPKKAAPKPPADSFWDADYGFDLLADGGANKMSVGFLEGQSSLKARNIQNIVPHHRSELGSETKSPRRIDDPAKTEIVSDNVISFGHSALDAAASDRESGGAGLGHNQTAQIDRGSLDDPKAAGLKEDYMKALGSRNGSAEESSVLAISDAVSKGCHGGVGTDELRRLASGEQENASVSGSNDAHIPPASSGTVHSNPEAKGRPNSGDSFWNDQCHDIVQDNTSMGSIGSQHNPNVSKYETSTFNDKRKHGSQTDRKPCTASVAEPENEEESSARNSPEGDHGFEKRLAKQTETGRHVTSSDELTDLAPSASEHSALNLKTASAVSQPALHAPDTVKEYDYSDSFSDLDESLHEEQLNTLVSSTLGNHGKCQSGSSELPDSVDEERRGKSEEGTESPGKQRYLERMDFDDGDRNRKAALMEDLIENERANLKKLLQGDRENRFSMSVHEESKNSKDVAGPSETETNSAVEFGCRGKPTAGPDNSRDHDILDGGKHRCNIAADTNRENNIVNEKSEAASPIKHEDDEKSALGIAVLDKNLDKNIACEKPGESGNWYLAMREDHTQSTLNGASNYVGTIPDTNMENDSATDIGNLTRASYFTMYDNEAESAHGKPNHYYPAVAGTTLSVLEDNNDNTGPSQSGTLTLAVHTGKPEVILGEEEDHRNHDATMSESHSQSTSLTSRVDADSCNDGSSITSRKVTYIDIPQSGSFHSSNDDIHPSASRESHLDESESDNNEEYSDSFTDESEEDTANAANEITESDESDSEASCRSDAGGLDGSDEEDIASDLFEQGNNQGGFRPQSSSPQMNDRHGSSTDSGTKNTERRSRSRKRRVRVTCRDKTSADRSDRRTPDPDGDGPHGLPPSHEPRKTFQAGTDGQSKSESKGPEHDNGQRRGKQQRQMSCQKQDNSFAITDHTKPRFLSQVEQADRNESKTRIPGRLQNGKSVTSHKMTEDNTVFPAHNDRSGPSRIQTAFLDVAEEERFGSLAPCKRSPLGKLEQRSNLFSGQMTTAYFKTDLSEPQRYDAEDIASGSPSVNTVQICRDACVSAGQRVSHDNTFKEKMKEAKGPMSCFAHDQSTTWIKNLGSGSHTMSQLLENGLLPQRPNLDQSLPALQRCAILGSLMVPAAQSQSPLVAVSPAVTRGNQA